MQPIKREKNAMRPLNHWPLNSLLSPRLGLSTHFAVNNTRRGIIDVILQKAEPCMIGIFIYLCVYHIKKKKEKKKEKEPMYGSIKKNHCNLRFLYIYIYYYNLIVESEKIEPRMLFC